MKKYTGSSVVDEVRNSVGDTRNDVHANHDSDGLWIDETQNSAMHTR